MPDKKDIQAVNWFRRIALGLTAILSIAFVITGAIAWGMAIGTWARDGYSFHGWGLIDWTIGMISAAVVAPGLLLAGLFFRFVPWDRAPQASLGLAIVSVTFILATVLIYSDTDTATDSFEVVLLQGNCILGLFVLSLPPFLHWYNAPGPVMAAGVTPAAKVRQDVLDRKEG